MTRIKSSVFFFFLILATFVGVSAFVIKSSNGIQGFTASPGEQTCAGGGCHSGGSSATKGVTISAVPSFSADQYMTDSIYQINIQVAAVGFTRFGFGCEILDSTNVNAGLMQNAGTGVKFLNAGAKRNAVQTTAKTSTTGAVTFSFKWKAPPEATAGRVNFYVCANAVNGNNNTSGDLPIPAQMFIYPAPAPENTVVVIDGLQSQENSIKDVIVYPNPSTDFANMSYSLERASQIKIDLLDLQGNIQKALTSRKQTEGSHSQILDLRGIPAGVYFVRTLIDANKVSQKLITVQ